MAVFPHHTRANECCQLAGHAASRVVPGTLQDNQAFPYNGILPDLAEFYGSAIRRAVRGRGATFTPKSRIGDVWSAALPQSDKGREAVTRPIARRSWNHNRWSITGRTVSESFT